MKIRAIVVDIDGTLTDNNKVMSTKAIDVLRAVQNSGTYVCLASGNTLPVAYGVSTYLGLKGPIIAENGGIVCQGENVYRLFSPELPEKAYEYLETKITC